MENRLKGKQYDKNARKITEKRLEDLKRYLAEFGDLSCIILNVQNGQYVGGNQRSKIMQEKARLVDMVYLEQADNVGTVAYGYVEYDGNKFSYREVCWDDGKHARASIIANNAGGENDFELLLANHADILDDVGLTDDAIGKIDELLSLEEIEEGENQPIFPIVPKFSEKHGCIVIVFDNELDENFLSQVLCLEQEQSYKNSNVSKSHVITAAKFTQAWNKSQS